MEIKKIPQILLVEDDPIWAQVMSQLLAKRGIIIYAKNEAEASAHINNKKIDIAFIDLDLDKRLAGLEIVEQARQKNIYSVIVSANDDSDTINKGYTYGSSDYLLKTGDQTLLEESINSTFWQYSKYLNESHIEKLIQSQYHTLDINTLESLRKIKRFDSNTTGIFIVGETGTGKKIVSDIVNEVINDGGPFLRVNCASINQSTLMSELFGHTKNAFTGANANKKGLLEQANGGVLFLDEIHELPLEAQKALLVAIESNKVRPVGSEVDHNIDIKIICAARENINDLIDENRFQIDLYYRLCRRRIDLYPIRNRRKDILFQLNFFLNRKKNANLAFIIKDEAKTLLENYNWPGNTREIENLVDEWLENSYRVIDSDNLPRKIVNNEQSESAELLNEHLLTIIEQKGLQEFLSAIKAEAIAIALEKNNGIPKRAASYLNVSKTTMHRYMTSPQLKDGGLSDRQAIH